MISRWCLSSLALVALLLSACASAPLGSGKGAFRAVYTDHFTIYTDLPESRAEEQGLRLEQLLFALQETGWESSAGLPLRMNVIMFAHAHDLQRFAKQDALGYAISEALFEPWFVLSAPRYGDQYGVVAHELTHAMSYQSIMRMPSWLSEGLASYFESAFFHVDGSFQIGSVPKHRYQSLRLGWDRPSQLIAGESKEEPDQRFYASSWLLVHYLMTCQADAFVRFQELLAKGVHGPEAWQRAFPDLQGDKLDQTVEDYMRAGVYESFIFDFSERRDVRVSSARISASDEHLLLALLFSYCDGCAQRANENAQRDLERALTLEPNNVRAQALKMSLAGDRGERDIEPLKALVRAYPSDWLSWLTLGMGASARQLRELSASAEWDPGAHAALLAPRQPYALALEAWTAALRGEREYALERMRQAQRLAPTNGKLQSSHASLLAMLSACDELRELIASMEQNAHAHLSPEALRALRSQGEACGEALPSNAPAR